jgi:hypothetical protein
MPWLPILLSAHNPAVFSILLGPCVDPLRTYGGGRSDARQMAKMFGEVVVEGKYVKWKRKRKEGLLQR